jgi:hypothetical protein
MIEQINEDVSDFNSGLKNLMNERDFEYDIIGIKFAYNQGVMVELAGAEFPQKGVAIPITMQRINAVKRMITESTKLIKEKEFLILVSLFMLKTIKGRIKFIEKIFNSFNSIAIKVIDNSFFKRYYLTSVARNLDLLISRTMINMGISKTVSADFGRVMSAVIEFDNAYRFRMQDAITEIDIDKLKNRPAKELLRVLEIYRQRDNEGVSRKIMILKPIIKILFMSKWFRNAFILALESINIDEMRFDANDRYWICQRGDYEFLGLSYEERMDMIEHMSLPNIKYK